MAALLLLLLVSAAPPPEGRFEGAIEIPGTPLKIVVEFGAKGGAISIPSQGLSGFALAEVKAEGDSVSFAMHGIPGDPRFRGTLSADGKRIEGTFEQGGASFPFRLERATGAEALDPLAKEIESLLALSKAPGVAIAVVRGAKTLFAEGYGVRKAGAPERVTGDTIFAIGSTTKAFTATLVQLLADEGKLSWDDLVVARLPEFRLKDPLATARITIRDLCTHLSGLPRHDLVWYGSPLDRGALLEAIAHLEPSADLRERFQYQNLMYMAAGALLERIEGKPWEAIVRERIFEPLSMTSAVASTEEAQKAADSASPHAATGDVATLLPFRVARNVAPAGAIHASAKDLGRWMAAHLRPGFLSEGALRALHAPRVAIPGAGGDPEVIGASYALGWMVDVYRGHERVHHGGNIDGFSAAVLLFPRDDLGVAVLANLDASPLPDVLASAAADRMLGLEPVDRAPRLAGAAGRQRAFLEEAQKGRARSRRAGTTPSRPTEEFAGEYEHPAYGGVTVMKELVVSIHGIEARLEHWHYDVFLATPTDARLAPMRMLLRFTTDLEGRVDGLAAALEPAVGEILFRRKPPARLLDPAFLDTLAGEYVLGLDPSVVVRIERRGARLVAHVPRQPPYDLEPGLETEFRARGARGYGVRFLPESGELLLLQPEGALAAQRKKP